MMRTTRTLYIAVLTMVSAMAPLGPRALAADAGGEVVARIGATDIKADDVRAYIATLPPQEQAALARDPNALSQAVRALLARQEVLKKALSQKWEDRPEVAAQIQKAREGVIVETYLESVAKVPDNFPDATQIQSAYDANKTAFLQPRQFELAQVFVAMPKDSDKAVQEKARAKLEAVKRKLKQRNADFAAIAQSDSDDAESAKRKGDLGWLFENQINPDIRSQVVGLAKGSVSEPIQLDDGWHMVKLLDTKPAHTRPLEEVHDQVVAALRQEQAMALRRAYLGKLLQEDPPAINELALSKLLPKSTTN